MFCVKVDESAVFLGCEGKSDGPWVVQHRASVGGGGGEDVMNGNCDKGHFVEGDVPGWSCGPRHPYPLCVSPGSWHEEHHPVTLDTLEDGEAEAVAT